MAAITAAEWIVLSIEGPFVTTPAGSCRADAERLADLGYLLRVKIPSEVDMGVEHDGFVRTAKGDLLVSDCAAVSVSHSRAMQAKQSVFRSQDSLSLAYQAAARIQHVPTQNKEMRRLDRLAKKLQRAREALEAFDREYDSYRRSHRKDFE